MSKKYQVTELDKVLEQFKGIGEWTDEQQKDWELRRKIESLTSQLEKVNTKKVELYTDNILLKREISQLKTQLKSYRKLQSEVHKDIERVWMYDSSLKPLTDKQKLDSMSLIYKVFYKIGNQWID